MNEIMKIRNLSKIYGKKEVRTTVLNNLSLDIEEGDFIAVMGPSGAGKSTLLNLLSTIDKPTQGSIILDGQELTAIRNEKLAKLRKEHIGFIFQAFNLIPELTVEQNIIFPVLLDYQKPDKSDLGTWRLPNEAELMIMAGSLFDWDDREKPKVYDFGGNLSSLNMKDGQVIHSRTGFSKRDMNGGRSFSAGYQMYFDGYLRFVTTVDTQWGGDKDRLVNDKKGYVRCVRDLE